MVRYGILRMKWRDGGKVPQLLTSGELYEVEVDMWATAYTFPAGHRLRVTVTSSNAPQFAPNPNTGDSFGNATVKANNTVFFSATHPSRVELPIVPLSSLPSNSAINAIDCGLAPPI